jgi:hypothetical protein
MSIQETLQNEIEDSKDGLNAHKKTVLTNEISPKGLNQ